MGLMGFLSKGSSELPAALDMAQGDPDATRLRGDLTRGNWKGAHEFLKSLTNPDDLDFYIESLARWPGRPGWIPRWQKGEPDSAITAMISGVHNIEWAWEARGGGSAESVSDEGFQGFVSRMSEGEIDLLKASYLDPKCPVPWAHLVATAFPLGADDAETAKRFASAIALHPHYRLAHSRRLYSLCAKWGGSHEAMFKFARDARNTAPDGSLLHGIIAEAHIERWLACYMERDEERGRQYFTQKSVQAELEDAWQHSLRSRALMKTKRINEDRNRFAFCFHMTGEKAKAKEEFRAIGPNVTEFPWTFLGAPIEKFAAARAEN